MKNDSQTAAAKRRRGAVDLALLLLVVGGAAIVRFVALGADPHYYGWIGYLPDEGRWTDSARALLQQGHLNPGAMLVQLFVSPGGHALYWLAFQLGDVSIATARLISALSGTALVVLTAWFVCRFTSIATAALVLALVFLQADVVMLSRLATPEMIALLAETLLFVGLYFARSRRQLAACGALLYVSVMLKATVLLIVPAFLLMAALGLRRATLGERLIDVLAFSGVAVALGLATLGVWVAADPQIWAQLLSEMTQSSSQFVGPKSPAQVVAWTLSHFMTPVFAYYALPLWFIGLSRYTTAGESLTDAHRRAAWMAATWVAPYAILTLVNTYYPGRYTIHALVPIAIITALAATELRSLGPVELGRRVAAGAPWLRCWAAVPAAFILAALLHHGYSHSAMSDNMQTVVALATAFAVFVGITHRVRSTYGYVYLVFAPLFLLSAWFIGWIVWPTPFPFFGLPLMYLMVGVLVTIALVWSTTRPQIGRLSRSTPALALAIIGVAAAWVVQLAPGLVYPTYTHREATKQLVSIISAKEVDQTFSESLFIDTNIHPRIVFPRRGPAPNRDLLVQTVWRFRPEFLSEYELIAEIPIRLPPQFLARNCTPYWHCDPDDYGVQVWQRIEPGGRSGQ